MRLLEDYLKDREKRKRAEPLKHWGSEDERQDFVVSMRRFLKDDVLSDVKTDPTQAEFRYLYRRFNAEFHNKIGFWMGEISGVLHKISKQLDWINMRIKQGIKSREPARPVKDAGTEAIKKDDATVTLGSKLKELFIGDLFENEDTRRMNRRRTVDSISSFFTHKLTNKPVNSVNVNTPVSTTSIESQQPIYPNYTLVMDQFGRGYYMQEMIDTRTGAKVFWEPQSQQIFTPMFVPVEAQQAVFNTLQQYQQQAVLQSVATPEYTVQTSQQPVQEVVQPEKPEPPVLQPEIVSSTDYLLLMTMRNSAPQVAPPANANVQQKQHNSYPVPASALTANGDVNGFEAAVNDLMSPTKPSVFNFDDILFPKVPTKPVVKAAESKQTPDNQKVAMPGQ